MSMRKHEKCYEVYTTPDYGMFKTLEGNRGLVTSRKNKVIASIKTFGWIRNPIIVNEKMEIVDGQARFEALKELMMPIDYIIDEGIGIEECRSMNIYQSNWTLRDYINSYAQSGNEDYVRLLELLKEYPDINPPVIYYAAISLVRRQAENVIKEGRFKSSVEKQKEIRDAMEYLSPLMPFIREVPGKKHVLGTAITFIYMHSKDTDTIKLARCIKKNCRLIAPIVTYDQALREVENLYNKNNRGKLANFVNEFKEYKRDT